MPQHLKVIVNIARFLSDLLFTLYSQDIFLQLCFLFLCCGSFPFIAERLSPGNRGPISRFRSNRRITDIFPVSSNISAFSEHGNANDSGPKGDWHICPSHISSDRPVTAFLHDRSENYFSNLRFNVCEASVGSFLAFLWMREMNFDRILKKCNLSFTTLLAWSWRPSK
jgi:hypothetical protein